MTAIQNIGSAMLDALEDLLSGGRWPPTRRVGSLAFMASRRRAKANMFRDVIPLALADRFPLRSRARPAGAFGQSDICRRGSNFTYTFE